MSLSNFYSGIDAGTRAKSVSLNLLNKKKIDDFVLHLPTVIIPGQFLFNVRLNIDVRSNVKVSILRQ